MIIDCIDICIYIVIEFRSYVKRNPSYVSPNSNFFFNPHCLTRSTIIMLNGFNFALLGLGLATTSGDLAWDSPPLGFLFLSTSSLISSYSPVQTPRLSPCLLAIVQAFQSPRLQGDCNWIAVCKCNLQITPFVSCVCVNIWLQSVLSSNI